MIATVSANYVPSFLQLVPEHLDLRVFRHTVETVGGRVACWSYVSDGLRRLGQKELVFTIRRSAALADDAFPRDPIDFFHLIFRQAREGKIIEAGGHSRFARPGGFLGCPGPVGMIYMDAVPLKGVNYPDRPLAAFLVTAEEVAVARAQGAYRILTLLGLQANVFPYPPWSNPDRDAVLSIAHAQQSLLAKVPLYAIRGLHARRQRNQVHVHAADAKALTQLEKALSEISPDGPFVFLTDPDPDAKARLVWKPGMAVETIAVDNRPNSSLTGGFIAFILTRSGLEGTHVCEDGFAAKLRPATWDKVKQALLDGDSLSVASHGQGMKLVIGLETDIEPVRQAGGQFFQDDASLHARVKPEDLACFDKRVGHVVEDHFADVKPADGEALSVFCAIRPGQQARFWVVCRPDELATSSRNLLMRRLAALKPPQVEAPIAWSMKFDLWGGTGDAKDFVTMPGEWKVALAGNKSPIVPEQILDRVWPL